MSASPAVLSAVLSTLIRATADPATPIVVCGAAQDPQRLRDLARWLHRVHGAPRVVVAGRRGATGVITVCLPALDAWPDPATIPRHPSHPPVAPGHLSPMRTLTRPSGLR